METKVYIDELEQRFLTFHLETALLFSDLEKFVGGDIGSVDGKPLVDTPQGPLMFEVGDYILYLTHRDPFSNVHLRIDGVTQRHQNYSFLALNPEVFNRNFKEVSNG